MCSLSIVDDDHHDDVGVAGVAASTATRTPTLLQRIRSNDPTLDKLR